MKRLLPLFGAAALVAALALPTGGVAAPKASTAAVKVKKVAIKDFDYSPKKITITAGTKVTWVNQDATNHTVTFTGKGHPHSPGNLNEKQTKSLVFAKKGTFKYLCDYHPNMHGTVVVK